MVGTETREGLFKAAIRVVDCGLVCVTVRGIHNLWHERLKHCGGDQPRASIPHIRRIEMKELTETV